MLKRKNKITVIVDPYSRAIAGICKIPDSIYEKNLKMAMVNIKGNQFCKKYNIKIDKNKW